jgi:small ligand-binding sensory domain FIST
MRLKAKSQIFVGEYSEGAVVKVARDLHKQLGSNASLGFLFVTQEWHPHLVDTLELIRVYGRVPQLAGCSGWGLIGNRQETELQVGFSLLLLSVPEESFTICPIHENEIEQSQGASHWRSLTRLSTNDVNSWVVLVNPYFSAAEDWLRQWDKAYPHTLTVGGLASSSTSEIFLFQDGEISQAAILAVGLKGRFHARPIVSQGCRPIGHPLPITEADDNLILEIGNLPAYQALEAAFLSVPADQRVAARHNLFLGLAVSEYIDDFKQGDFLIRNILGADPQIGALAVGAYPRVGQTIQFQLRDSVSAHHDLIQTAEHGKAKITDAIGILLFSCSGRGKGLFGSENHDATIIADVFGDLPLAGFFCNGEIGPVGNHTFLHSYTASAAVFCFS